MTSEVEWELGMQKSDKISLNVEGPEPSHRLFDLPESLPHRQKPGGVWGFFDKRDELFLCVDIYWPDLKTAFQQCVGDGGDGIPRCAFSEQSPFVFSATALKQIRFFFHGALLIY